MSIPKKIVFKKDMFFIPFKHKIGTSGRTKTKKRKIIALTHAIWISNFTCMRSQQYYLLVYNTQNEKKENKIETSECYKLFPFVELIMEDLK